MIPKLTSFNFPIFCPDTGEKCNTYGEYLKSKHWEIIKERFYNKKILNNERIICSCCEIPDKTLNLHHLTYENLGEENLDELSLLCTDCHTELHEERYFVPPPKIEPPIEKIDKLQSDKPKHQKYFKEEKKKTLKQRMQEASVLRRKLKKRLKRKKKAAYNKELDILFNSGMATYKTIQILRVKYGKRTDDEMIKEVMNKRKLKEIKLKRKKIRRLELNKKP